MTNINQSQTKNDQTPFQQTPSTITWINLVTASTSCCYRSKATDWKYHCNENCSKSKIYFYKNWNKECVLTNGGSRHCCTWQPPLVPPKKIFLITS